jgi:transposase
VHLDESGFSQRPSVVRTWAPRGRTPTHRSAFNWKRLSVIGALAVAPDLGRVRVFLSLRAGSVDHVAVVAFLRSLRRHLRVPALLVWDRLSAHIAGPTRKHLAGQHHWLDVEWLPGYAPELNPVEYLWNHLDRTDLANFCADDLGQLAVQVQRGARRVRRTRELSFAFLKHSGLYPELSNILCEPQ